MPIQTSCPHCRTNYRLPDSQLGKRVRCKSCSDTFLVEDEEEVPVLEEATAAEVRAHRAAPPPAAEIVEDLPVFEAIGPPPTSSSKRTATAPPLPRRGRDDEEQDEEPAPRSGGSSLLLILGGVAAVLLLLGVGGGLGLYFALRPSAPAGGNQASAPPADTSALPPVDKGNQGGPTVPRDDGGRQPPVGVPPKTERRGEPKDVADAVDWLRDADPQPRDVALRYLESNPVDQVRRADVVRGVRPILRREQPGRRDSAARVLARYAGRGDISDLVLLLDDTDSGVWRAAMTGLGKIDDEQAAEELAKQLSRADRRFDASTALGEAGARAEKHVVKHLHAENLGQRNTARQLLGKYGTAEDVLLEQTATDLGSSQSATKRIAAEWLVLRRPAGEPPDRVSKALEPLLSDADAPTRQLAARAMERWATTGSVPGLVAALKDNALAGSLLTALGRLKDERALPIVVNYLATGEQATAVKALVAYGDKAEPTMLVLVQKSAIANIRQVALSILAEVGTKKSLAALPNYARWHPRDRANIQLAADAMAKIKGREK